jgi:hypothetical protein
MGNGFIQNFGGLIVCRLLIGFFVSSILINCRSVKTGIYVSNSYTYQLLGVTQGTYYVIYPVAPGPDTLCPSGRRFHLEGG